MEEWIEHKGEYYLRVDYDRMMRKNARRRERYATDPEYRERKLNKAKQWAIANREAKNNYNREYMRRMRHG